jgi:flagellar biosynthesis protein FlhG
MVANSTEVPGSRPQVWAVGGGKGGTGKSLMAASLGIHLAQTGHRVVLIDGDLGTPNLHTFLGLDAPAVSLSDFVRRRVAALDEAAVATSIPGLRLVSGARNSLDAESLKHFQKTRLLRLLADLPADVVILDLGAGTSLTTLDLFAPVDQGVMVILPEPTSIENAYRFAKGAWFRRLQHLCRILGYGEILDLVLRHREEAAVASPAAVLEKIDRIDRHAADRLMSQMAAFSPHLVINQARDGDDTWLGEAMEVTSRRMLLIPLRFAGAVPHDPALVRSVKDRRPFLADASPYSRTGMALRSVADTLGSRSALRAAPARVLPAGSIA